MSATFAMTLPFLVVVELMVGARSLPQKSVPDFGNAGEALGSLEGHLAAMQPHRAYDMKSNYVRPRHGGSS